MNSQAQPTYRLDGPAAPLVGRRYVASHPHSLFLDECLRGWQSGRHLSLDQARQAFEALGGDEVSEYQIGAFLVLATPEFLTADEIAGFAGVLRARADRVQVRAAGRELGDTCGTGGDTIPTFNVSTAGMFVVAAGGAPMAKHGNRAFTSRCGSADVLEALGVNVTLGAAQVQACIERIGIGFMFAPVFHAATRRVQALRKSLASELPDGVKLKTVFNVLGPLANPASAGWQLLGVYHPSLVEKLASALCRLGVRRALVVHGRSDDPAHAGRGLDEISTLGPTDVAEVRRGQVRMARLTPDCLGLPKAEAKDVRGGDTAANRDILKGMFDGIVRGPRRDLVAANAAAGLYLAKAGDDDVLEDCLVAYVREAADLIETGQARRKLDDLIRVTRDLGGGAP